MAKGNLFQGMARGAVGDVVFSRLNGQQVSRVRNRRPANPQTNSQLYQRAIMASVMQAYSYGKKIFDHSFEGKKTGSECQNAFLSLNSVKLRAAVAADLDNSRTLADQVGHVISPKQKTVAPFGFIVSDGSYDNDLTNELGVMPAPAEGQTIAQYCAANGIVPGDYYTLVAFATTDEELFKVVGSTGEYGTLYGSKFGFVRLKVKDSVTTDTEVLTANSTKNKIFTVDLSAGFESIGGLSTSKLTDALTVGFELDGLACSAVIRSRLDSGLRSHTEMVVTDNFATGIVSQYALDAWKQGTAQVGDSDLILEGGESF